MKKVVLYFALLFNVTIVCAQNQCLTTAPAPPQWIFNKSAKSLLVSPTYRMNIFVHIVRSSSGQGLGIGILPTILSSLNSSFQSADIQFSMLGSDFIDNDDYYVNLNGDENQLFSVNARCNAIDIYVLGQTTTWDGAGLAQNIPSTALIVHGNYYTTSSLPHEMGHCLGLYHTHHGTVNEGGGDTNQCAELVNGSNSLICGDYISDTSADPNKWSSNSCSYIGTGVDANGDPYNPSVSNLMSYAYKPCRTTYSNLQIGRMKAFIDNTPMLQNTFASSISGNSIVCSSGTTFTLDYLPSGATVTWTATSTNNNLSINPSTGYANASGSTSGDGTITAVVNTNCGNITLPTKAVWVGAPIVNYISGPSSIGTYQPATYYAELSSYASSPDSYFWGTSPLPGVTITQNGQSASIMFTQPGYYQVVAKAHNTCDWSSYSMRIVNVTSGYRMAISPNPSTGETTVELVNDNKEALAALTEWDYEIYDSMQGLKEKKTKLKAAQTKINTTNWKDGVYIIRAKIGDEVITGKLVVKH